MEEQPYRMSNPYNQTYNSPPPSPLPPRPSGSNGVGTAGFVVSLIGLFSCGLLSIFGLGISLFGLRKNPKGLAIAGVALGAVGLGELILLAFFLYNFAQAAGVVRTAVYRSVSEEVASEIANDVAEEWELTDQLPSEAEGQRFAEGKTDLFETRFRYETDGNSFTIRGAGQDYEFDTADDATVGPFNNAQEAFDFVAERKSRNESESPEMEDDFEF